MTGYLLFKHAVKRVFQNLDDALAISGLIWVGVMAIMVLVTAFLPSTPLFVADTSVAQPTLTVDWGQFRILMVLNVIALLASIWVAIEWHRFVLLGERPNSIVPVFRMDLFQAYFGKSLLIMAAMIVVAVVVVTIVTFLMTLIGGVQFVPALSIVVLSIFGMYAFYRVSPILPAAALGQSLTLKEAWGRTESHKQIIFRATFLMIFATMALQVPSLFAGAGPLSIVVSLATGWIGLMVGVSLLSAIYELSTSADDR